LIDKIAKDSEDFKVQASNALNSALDGVVSTLKKGNKVTLVGFGTFSGQLPESAHRPQPPDRRTVEDSRQESSQICCRCRTEEIY